MSRKLGVGLAAAALALGFVLAAQANAADPDFCRDYARAAVDQVHAAFDSHRCDFAVQQTPARWTRDFQAHFDWCRGASRKDVDRERDARQDTLNHCLHDGHHGDMDHDHAW